MNFFQNFLRTYLSPGLLLVSIFLASQITLISGKINKQGSSIHLGAVTGVKSSSVKDALKMVPKMSLQSRKTKWTGASRIRRSVVSETVNCPENFVLSTVSNICFMTSMRRVPYKEAKAYCSQNKGIMVSMESKDKHVAVVTFLKRNHFGSDATFWLSPIGSTTNKFWLSNMEPVVFDNFKENTVSVEGSCNIIGLQDEKWMRQDCKSVVTVNHQNVTNVHYVVCEPFNATIIHTNLEKSGVVNAAEARDIAMSKKSKLILQKLKHKMAKSDADSNKSVGGPTTPHNDTSMWDQIKTVFG